MTLIQHVVWLPLAILGTATRVIEALLFIMITWYDEYIYSPLQTSLSPVVDRIPRTIVINGTSYDVFTANIVSWARTVLVIPIVVCLKYQYFGVAFILVFVHDFLDHVDGIVAKQHKKTYGQVDDPLLGGFMDAFCDKIVNVLSLWSILMVTDFSPIDFQGRLLVVSSCGVIIVYEFVIGVVRVQDYFRAFYQREYNIPTTSAGGGNTAAVMEGKLKEKLESVGIAFLCLAQGSPNIIQSFSGIIGIVCLLLSVRLAHASLRHKLNARKSAKTDKKVDEPSAVQERVTTTYHGEKTHTNNGDKSTQQVSETCEKAEERLTVKDNTPRVTFDRNVSYEDDGQSSPSREMLEADPHLQEVFHRLRRQQSVPNIGLDGRVDKVYTVGCFDLFHQGHSRLLNRLKAIGKEVIVGVHDSRSIFKLKKRVPIDSTERRMFNVKQIADVVYCIAGTDPTPFLSCIVNISDGRSCVYIRGDDMQHFPAREFCEKIMPVTFLPYSTGVSSTQIRTEKHDASEFGPHVKSDYHDIMY